jgi:hypothetical protein
MRQAFPVSPEPIRHRAAMGGLEPQQGEGHADLVVEIAPGGQGGADLA